jgi:hypothetical protein
VGQLGADRPRRRYDAFLSFVETAALRPLGRATAAAGGERDTEPWAS